MYFFLNAKKKNLKRVGQIVEPPFAGDSSFLY